MQSNWQKKFYEKQFDFINDHNYNDSLFYQQEAEAIQEQIGKQYETVLELGAGYGKLANAIAALDKNVTTIELADKIVKYALQEAHPNVKAICADFYTIRLNKKFDVVLYIDGFGVGSEQDQVHILKRIYNWLDINGIALIDIYQPLYWIKVNGIEMQPTSDPTVRRQYGYNKDTQSMTDTWWSVEDAEDKYTQILACYTPEQIEILCQKAGLQIVGYFPGGAMDYNTWTYQEVASLENCLSYRIKVKRNDI